MAQRDVYPEKGSEKAVRERVVGLILRRVAGTKIVRLNTPYTPGKGTHNRGKRKSQKISAAKRQSPPKRRQEREGSSSVSTGITGYRGRDTELLDVVKPRNVRHEDPVGPGGLETLISTTGAVLRRAYEGIRGCVETAVGARERRLGARDAVQALILKVRSSTVVDGVTWRLSTSVKEFDLDTNHTRR
ncbi:hypothetical protein C8R44DRAFT_736120 [Mycena epipterygia]|nr:hypothetical protein C8R44DRAFT_736120 [Mycena epipterygia]